MSNQTVNNELQSHLADGGSRYHFQILKLLFIV